MKRRALITAGFLLAIISLPLMSAESIRPMGEVKILIKEDLSAVMIARVYRVIHPPETRIFTEKYKIPLFNWVVYEGNVTLSSTPSGARGNYTLFMVPLAGDPQRADFFPKAAAAKLFDNATVHALMNFFYGADYLTIYGIRWSFVNVTYQSAPLQNYTGVSALASAATRSKVIESVEVSYRSFTRKQTGTMVVDYNITMKSRPLELETGPGGVKYLDLTPLTSALPDGIAANLEILINSTSYQITGASPLPKMISWNRAVWVFIPQLQETGKVLVVTLRVHEASVPPQAVLLAMIPPIVVGAYLVWRIRARRISKG